jgi:hypothetical protein
MLLPEFIEEMIAEIKTGVVQGMTQNPQLSRRSRPLRPISFDVWLIYEKVFRKGVSSPMKAPSRFSRVYTGIQLSSNGIC